jgi:hypothetical protein
MYTNIYEFRKTKRICDLGLLMFQQNSFFGKYFCRKMSTFWQLPYFGGVSANHSCKKKKKQRDKYLHKQCKQLPIHSAAASIRAVPEGTLSWFRYRGGGAGAYGRGEVRLPALTHAEARDFELCCPSTHKHFARSTWLAGGNIPNSCWTCPSRRRCRFTNYYHSVRVCFACMGRSGIIDLSLDPDRSRDKLH